MHSPGKLQRGVALITALLVVALATVAAVGLASRQQLDIRRTGSLLHGEQAQAYVLGAESWARVVLARDQRESKVDTLEEDWATQPPISSVEGGTVLGRVLDMQGRFNINSLVVEGKPNDAAIDRYRRLLSILELDEVLIDPLVDWMDADIDVRFPDGAEDETYQLLQPAYRTANRNLVDVSELRLIKGYDNNTVARLRPFIVVLPEPAPLNVNTALAEVLRTLAPDMSASDADTLIEGRGDEGYARVEDFMQQSVLQDKAVNAADLSVISNWFLVISEANIGQGRARLASLLQRSRQDMRTVRRKRVFFEPVIAPVEEEDQQQ